jgi:hypothetical protein
MDIEEMLEEAEMEYRHELDGWFLVNRFLTSIWLLDMQGKNHGIPWSEWREGRRRMNGQKVE